MARAVTLPGLVDGVRARRASGISRILWQELGPAGRYALLGIVTAGVVTIALGGYLPSAVREQLIRVEARGVQAAAAALEGSLPPLDGRTKLGAAEQAALDRLLRERFLGGDSVRVKLWTLDGIVLYSDERSLVGRRFPSALPRLQDAVTSGTSADVSDLEEPEHVAEDTYPRLVEIYVPVHDPDTGRPVAVLETYEDVTFLVSALSTIEVITWSSIAIAIAGLVVFLGLWATATFRSIEKGRSLAEARARDLGILVDASAALASSLDSASLFAALRERLVPALGLAEFAIAPADEVPQGAFVAPLRDGRTLVADRAGVPFTRDEQRLIGSAAASLDAALANAALYEQVHEAAEERRTLLQRVAAAHEVERRRIVGELHDTLANQLLRAVYSIRRSATAPRVPIAIRRDLAAIEAIVAGSELRLREFMDRVLPSAIDTLGLTAALEDLVVRVARESDLAISLDIRGRPDRLSDDAALTVLRAAEECLMNVHKHASANRVRITLAERRHAVLLVVEDDGVGWGQPVATREGHGLGLAYLRERVAGFSGRVRTGRGGLGGAGVIVRIPVP